jgi:hypothetical protein
MAGKGGRTKTSWTKETAKPGPGPPKLTPLQKLEKEELRERAKLLADKALKVVEQILDDPKAPPNAKLGAAQEIFLRAYGKPDQTINANLTIWDQISASERAALLAAVHATIRELESEEPRALEAPPDYSGRSDLERTDQSAERH